MEVNVSVIQIGPSASRGNAREHTTVMDRPEAKGGENRGAMGGEHLLMALGGCFIHQLRQAGTRSWVRLPRAERYPISQ